MELAVLALIKGALAIPAQESIMLSCLTSSFLELISSRQDAGRNLRVVL